MRVPKLIRAYCAGFIDGEGTIYILKQTRGKSTWHYIKVEASNTNKAPLEYLQSNYGGTIYEHIRQGEHRKIIYIWCLSTRRAFTFLKEIEPYLKVKHKQAQLAIQLQERIMNYNSEYKTQHFPHAWRLSNEEVEAREQLRFCLKQLTKRGIMN